MLEPVAWEWAPIEHPDLEFRIIKYRDTTYDWMQVFLYQGIVTGPDGFMTISSFGSEEATMLWLQRKVREHR